MCVLIVLKYLPYKMFTTLFFNALEQADDKKRPVIVFIHGGGSL